MHTDIHALSWIRTHDPSVRANEDVHTLNRAATVITITQYSRLKINGHIASIFSVEE
jgi:hypothetical protein